MEIKNEAKRGAALTNTKRTVLRIAAILVAVFIICTMVSQQIYRSLLPVVELTPVITDKALENRTEADGMLTYTALVPIRAKGTWRVTEVPAASGEKIAAGAEILKFDTSETALDEARLRLSISALESQGAGGSGGGTSREQIKMQLEVANAELSYHLRDYPEDGVIRAEEDGELSPRWYSGKEAAKGDYVYSINGTKYYAKANWVIKEYTAKVGSYVKKGDALFTIDVEDANLTLAQLRINVKQLEDSLKSGNSSSVDKEQLQAQIDIANSELLQHIEKYPSDGVFRAEETGVLVRLAVGVGDIVSEDQILGYIAGSGAQVAAQWTLSRGAGAKASDSTKVTVEIYDKETVTITTGVYNKIWDSENGVWTLTARLSGYKSETPLESVRVKILMDEPSERFPYVLPLSCLQSDGSGKYFVYAIEEREGLFSKETIVRRVDIKDFQKDNLNVGFGELTDASVKDVVRYTSQPLYDGCVVKVVG